jgi:hypothetical protein
MEPIFSINMHRTHADWPGNRNIYGLFIEMRESREEQEGQ